jgi:hypothetical protein
MCDYSLQTVASRPAAVGDKLVTRDFGIGTRGFAAPEGPRTAVCLPPGTEIAFPNGLRITHRGFLGWPLRNVRYVTAIFRQINKQSPRTHHDAIEFPDGHTVLLTACLKDRLRPYCSSRYGPQPPPKPRSRREQPMSVEADLMRS